MSGRKEMPSGTVRMIGNGGGGTECTRLETFRSEGRVKVVLFCGGLGTRLKEYSETIPKPLVTIGYRPIMWHLMRYYAHFGHKDFILCLGYRGDQIKEYFLDYNECISNDFVMRKGGREIELLRSDIDDWRITFVDTGQQANIGQRLLAVRDFVEDDIFLANYSDGLTDLISTRTSATQLRPAPSRASSPCVLPTAFTRSPATVTVG